jgi:glycine cleavage system H protein
MTEYLEITVDKFIFRVAKDCFYNSEGVWARLEGDRVKIGLSDFVQQRSGDVAFAEVKPKGKSLNFDEEIAVIETIKVDISFSSPLAGTIVEVNPAMDEAPEVINEDPYGEGWLAVIEPDDWEFDRQRLFDAPQYFSHMKLEAEEEVAEGNE